MSYLQTNDTRSLVETIGNTIDVVDARGKEVRKIIKNIYERQLPGLRDRFIYMNDQYGSRITNILAKLHDGDYRTAWQYVQGFLSSRALEGSFSEPDLTGMRQLLGYVGSLLKDGKDVDAAKRKLEDFQAEVQIAQAVHDFMYRLRTLYVVQALEHKGLDWQQAFNCAYDIYLKEKGLIRGSPKEEIFRLAVFRPAFIPFMIDHPQKKNQRLINPFFLAVTSLIQIQRSLSFDLMSRHFQRRHPETASLLSQFASEHKHVFTDLSFKDRRALVGALARDHQLIKQDVHMFVTIAIPRKRHEQDQYTLISKIVAVAEEQEAELARRSSADSQKKGQDAQHERVVRMAQIIENTILDHYIDEYDRGLLCAVGYIKNDKAFHSNKKSFQELLPVIAELCCLTDPQKAIITIAFLPQDREADDRTGKAVSSGLSDRCKAFRAQLGFLLVDMISVIFAVGALLSYGIMKILFFGMNTTARTIRYVNRKGFKNDCHVIWSFWLLMASIVILPDMLVSLILQSLGLAYFSIALVRLEAREDQKKAEAKLFDNRLSRLWNERMQKGGVFRYRLSYPQYRRVGDFILFLNQGRARAEEEKKRSFVDWSPVFEPFGRTDNFNRIYRDHPHQRLFTQRIGFQRLVVNVNHTPYFSCHFLLIPSPKKNVEQFLILSNLKTIYRVFRLSYADNLYFGFNSRGAWASINHLHFHGIYYPFGVLPIDQAVRQIVAKEQSVRISKVSDYPLRGLIFESAKTRRLIKATYSFISFLQNHNIPHVVLFARDRTYVFPGNRKMRTLSRCGIGFLEAAGVMYAGDQETFNTLAEVDVAQELSLGSLSSQQFDQLIKSWKASSQVPASPPFIPFFVHGVFNDYNARQLIALGQKARQIIALSRKDAHHLFVILFSGPTGTLKTTLLKAMKSKIEEAGLSATVVDEASYSDPRAAFTIDALAKAFSSHNILFVETATFLPSGGQSLDLFIRCEGSLKARHERITQGSGSFEYAQQRVSVDEIPASSYQRYRAADLVINTDVADQDFIQGGFLQALFDQGFGLSLPKELPRPKNEWREYYYCSIIGPIAFWAFLGRAAIQASKKVFQYFDQRPRQENISVSSAILLRGAAEAGLFGSKKVVDRLENDPGAQRLHAPIGLEIELNRPVSFCEQKELAKIIKDPRKLKAMQYMHFSSDKFFQLPELSFGPSWSFETQLYLWSKIKEALSLSNADVNSVQVNVGIAHRVWQKCSKMQFLKDAQILMLAVVLGFVSDQRMRAKKTKVAE
ncbi:MAG TPA: hypothetical protein PLO93_03040, partial [Candidatus Omnitrophota bacterium]|nr:hypothetical protein [Candidatus Omnitrophota bacterium]